MTEDSSPFPWPLEDGAFVVPKDAPDAEVRQAQVRHIEQEDGPGTKVCEDLEFRQRRHPMDAPGFANSRISAQEIAVDTIVGDIDASPGRTPAFETASALSNALTKMSVDHNAALTGGRGIHITCKYDLDRLRSGIPADLWERAERSGVDLLGRFADHFLRLVMIAANVEPEHAGMDLTKNAWNRNSLGGSLLRVVGCRRDGGGVKNYYPKVDGQVVMVPEYETVPYLYFPRPLERFDPAPFLPRFLHEIMASLDRAERDPVVVPAEPVQAEDLPCVAGLVKGGFEEGVRDDAAFALAIGCKLMGMDEERTAASVEGMLNTCKNVEGVDTCAWAREKVRSASRRDYLPCSLVRHIDPGLCDRSRCALHPANMVLPITLSEIEAKLAGRKVRVQVQIVGQKDKKALPGSQELYCKECPSTTAVSLLDEPEALLARYFKPSDLPRVLRSLGHKACNKGHRFACLDSKEKMDFAVLFVRDVIENDMRFTLQTATIRELYLAGQTLPIGNKVEIEGTVVVNPKTSDIAIVATSAKPLQEDFEGYVPTEEERRGFAEYFQNRRDAHTILAPHLVGEPRDIAKQWACLTHHSVREIMSINRRRVRGYLQIAFIGDGRTGKSDIANEGTGAPRTTLGVVFGESYVAETGGRTGLLYTIDNDHKALIWGVLPLNDLGYVAIDGLQACSSEEMGQYREARVTGRVKVDRSQRGEAPIRVRQIACLNARKRLSSYVFPAEAILDSVPFEDAVDVARWDAFVPFDEQDVLYDSIVESEMAPTPLPPELYHAHVMWAWSLRLEDIVYGPGFVESIKRHSKRLNDRYRIASLPLVYNEVHDTVTRVAVAFAALWHSTDAEHRQVIALEEHAQAAYDLMVRTYDLLKLAEYRDYEEGQTNLLGSEFARLVTGGLSPDDFSILEAIKTGRKTSEELADILQMSPEAVRRYHYPKLTEHELIKIGKLGCSLSDKGRMFVKRWLEFCAPAISGSTAGEAASTVNPKFTAAPPLEAPMFDDGTETEPKTTDILPADRSTEATVAEIKRNLNASFRPDWKEASMDDIGRFLKHMFGGNEDQAKVFFRTACEKQWLPYQVRVDGRVIKRP